VTSGSFVWDPIAIPPQPAVPEPSTWAMMLIGFAGLGYAGYRQARGERPAPAPRLSSKMIEQSLAENRKSG
jgi:PEP-CTERM motif